MALERLTFTVDEAALILGISRATAYNLAKSGKLPAIRISARRLVIPRKALEKMLEIEGATNG
jgi:excisionase family DNA binding protein